MLYRDSTVITAKNNLLYSFFITLGFIFTLIVVKVERLIENTFSIIFL